MIEGLLLSPLKIIDHDKGNIFHGLKVSDESYAGFGEAYFSTVKGGEIKGWKKHLKMTLNLIVPLGSIRFVALDARNASPTKGQWFEVVLGQENYQRLTIPPGVWLAFQGVKDGQNMLLNIASIEHDPSEAVSLPLEDLSYEWCF